MAGRGLIEQEHDLNLKRVPLAHRRSWARHIARRLRGNQSCCHLITRGRAYSITVSARSRVAAGTVHGESSVLADAVGWLGLVPKQMSTGDARSLARYHSAVIRGYARQKAPPVAHRNPALQQEGKNLVDDCRFVGRPAVRAPGAAPATQSWWRRISSSGAHCLSECLAVAKSPWNRPESLRPANTALGRRQAQVHHRQEACLLKQSSACWYCRAEPLPLAQVIAIDTRKRGRAGGRNIRPRCGLLGHSL